MDMIETKGKRVVLEQFIMPTCSPPVFFFSTIFVFQIIFTLVNHL